MNEKIKELNMVPTVAVYKRFNAQQDLLETMSIVNNGFYDLYEFFGAALDSFSNEIKTHPIKISKLELHAFLVTEFTRNLTRGGQDYNESHRIYTFSKLAVINVDTMEQDFHKSVFTVLHDRHQDESHEACMDLFIRSKIIELIIEPWTVTCAPFTTRAE